jgi:signal transduction histidine kinase
MRDIGSILLTALGWGAGGAMAAWVATWPLRRRSQIGVLIAIAAVATVASVAAVIGNTRAMFITIGDEYVTITASVVSGLLASIAAVAAARSFRRDSAFLREELVAMGEGNLAGPTSGSLTRELQAVRDELHRTAATLAESRDRERSLERSRRELITWISHDLRTPLAGLRAMAEALEDGVAKDPAHYHSQIRLDADRLTDMVDDLFHLSRLQTGTVTNHRERVVLTDLVSDAVASLEPLAIFQGVRLVGSSTMVAEVIGDSAQLNRALTNLVYNAIRHTRRAGTVQINLAAGPEPACAVLTVHDECGGIPSAEVARVFEIGYRGERARTPHPDPALGPGAGLGLAITREIVTAHAGSVDVSNFGPGCVFTVVLPLAA